MNTEGSYRCNCADKYRKNSTSKACEGKRFIDSNKNDDDDKDKTAIKKKMIMHIPYQNDHDML